MKKIFKVIGSICVTAYFSICMFYCFISGAPAQRENLLLYIICAAGFSIGLPVFTCLCMHYINYLQKKLNHTGEN